MKKTFYFDCGAILKNDGKAMAGDRVIWPHVFVPFDCDVPEEHSQKKLSLMFLCNNANQKESKRKNVLVLPVTNTRLFSKFAYFKLKE